MIKRTLYFGNPAYLSTENRQLVIRLPDKCGSGNAVTKSIPIEDIGVVVLDNRQITITQAALESLSENASAVIVCDSTHHPVSLQLPLDGNTLQSERFARSEERRVGKECRL